MSPLNTDEKTTIIVVGDANDFAKVLLLSRAAYKTQINVIPIQSENESLNPMSINDDILFVIDPSFSRTEAQNRIIQYGVSIGARWCSLKNYRDHKRGYAEINNIHDLLEWLEYSNDQQENIHYAKIKCFTRRMTALLLLITTLPLLIIIALFIKFTSPGPVIYKQIRVGFKGKKFQLLKFRSMHLDSEKTGPQWSTGDADPRTFAFGRFLRKTHLDELPQLWNIVKGELCFIGPRPERPEFHDLLEKAIPHFSARIRVKPGVTGWAQLLAGYASSVEDSKRKIAHDLFFIKNKNTALQMRIIKKTIQKMTTETISSVCRYLVKFISREN